MKIKKQDNIVEIIQNYPITREVFMQFGLGCIGCFAARFETLEEGATAHGIDTDALVEELNKAAGL
jgi:hybrid cluster-associated redox disulfide protein